MENNTIIGLRNAARVAGVTPETVRLWCLKRRGALGVLVSGVWQINESELKKVSDAHKLIFGKVTADA